MSDDHEPWPWQSELPAESPRRRQLRMTAASLIKPRPVRWLWDGRIPIGEVTLTPGALSPEVRVEWFDPRTGQRRRAASEADAENRFRAPDDQDWLLLLKTPEKEKSPR